jgi:hypothetical protein
MHFYAQSESSSAFHLPTEQAKPDVINMQNHPPYTQFHPPTSTASLGYFMPAGLTKP